LSNNISTHVLDITTGKPGDGIEVLLQYQTTSGWKELGRELTSNDGRATNLGVNCETLKPGIYQLHFGTEAYWKRKKISSFFPFVVISFEVTESSAHYHVPLLLSPFGYSTYRGS
jgi:5-hydroxyisourate hydrolase